MTMTPPERTPQQRAAWSLREAICRAAREGFGAAMVERPIPGLSIPQRDVEPLAGVRAAVLAREVATGRLQDYAEQARAQGSSWDEVAQVLGVEGDQGQWSRAEVAYLHLIEARPLASGEEHPWRTRPAARWRCGCCGQLVMDRGPFEAAPFNNEEGHAPECARHAAEVAAYRAEWGEQW